MHRHRDFSPREVPFSQLDRALSVREESHDGLASFVGLRPERRMMAGNNQRVDNSSVKYVWPESRSQQQAPRRRA
jgi:hypothetical protein